MKVSPFPFSPDDPKGIDSVPNVNTDDPEMTRRLQFLSAQTKASYLLAIEKSSAMNTAGGNIAPGFTTTVQGKYVFSREQHPHVAIDAYRLMKDVPGSGETAGSEGTLGVGADTALAEIAAGMGLTVESVRYRDAPIGDDSPVGAPMTGPGFVNQYWHVSASFDEAKYPIGSVYKYRDGGSIINLRRSAVGGYGGSKPTPAWQRVSIDQ